MALIPQLEALFFKLQKSKENATLLSENCCSCKCFGTHVFVFHCIGKKTENVAIGFGFYGNSEANDGMYQLTSSLLTANHTLFSIDMLVSDTITALRQTISGPLTSLENVFGGNKPALVSTRSCRRLSERVMALLSSLTLGKGLSSVTFNASDGMLGVVTPALPSMSQAVTSSSNSAPAPFSPGWAASILMMNEDYRWLSYVLLLLLDLVVCLFILLGLAKQARWLLILVRMTILAWLALFLSWGSLGLETATVVLLTQSQRALSSIHSHLSSLERDALPRFPKADNPLREVQQMLNSTEGNFHQLVALLNCRSLNKDYIDSLKGLCYDGMEGLLYLSLYSFLSALAFTAILCSLPGAWRSFSRTPNTSSNGNPGYESLPLSDRQSPPPSVSSPVCVPSS
ncbi:hypothetical protein QTP70_000059 [Hemibagrus guttatus]|uniref:Protein tweety homolog n=1 Tax=Hemibagrus guttatus TaxID=175788 RepID=A0AAE0RC98_9TELE|nr:hypothetical protein QTP70_000059 [Hemibagrus guttatus]